MVTADAAAVRQPDAASQKKAGRKTPAFIHAGF